MSGLTRKVVNQDNTCDLFPLAPIFEPRCEKTGLQGFRPGPTQTGLYNYRGWLKAWNFGFRK